MMIIMFMVRNMGSLSIPYSCNLLSIPPQNHC